MGIFGLGFEKAIAIFEINTLELQHFLQNKFLKFGTTNAWCTYFWGGICKYYFHVLNLCPPICLNVKFGAKTKIVKKKFVKKTKIPKFGTETSLFGHFRLEFENDIFIIETNNPNLFNCKISRKKGLNLGPKMSELCISGLEFENTIFIFGISVLGFVFLQKLVEK